MSETVTLAVAVADRAQVATRLLVAAEKIGADPKRVRATSEGFRVAAEVFRAAGFTEVPTATVTEVPKAKGGDPEATEADLPRKPARRPVPSTDTTE